MAKYWSITKIINYNLLRSTRKALNNSGLDNKFSIVIFCFLLFMHEAVYKFFFVKYMIMSYELNVKRETSLYTVTSLIAWSAD